MASRPVRRILCGASLDVPWWPSLSAGGCPPALAAYPGVSADGPPSPCLALLPVGFAEPPGSPRTLVRSYRTVSPLPVRRVVAIGGLFSVALSCGSPRLGVTQHRALRSPDVPRTGRAGSRPPGRLATTPSVPHGRPGHPASKGDAVVGGGHPLRSGPDGTPGRLDPSRDPARRSARAPRPRRRRGGRPPPARRPDRPGGTRPPGPIGVLRPGRRAGEPYQRQVGCLPRGLRVLLPVGALSHRRRRLRVPRPRGGGGGGAGHAGVRRHAVLHRRRGPQPRGAAPAPGPRGGRRRARRDRPRGRLLARTAHTEPSRAARRGWGAPL